MLPKTGELLMTDFKVAKRPSKAYRLNASSVSGHVDNLDAVRQAVYCILNTERYDWLIYSWNYGIELQDLHGKPVSLVKSKLKKRIREALTQDDRIQSVDAFLFEQNQKGKLTVSFVVKSIYGEIQADREVIY